VTMTPSSCSGQVVAGEIGSPRTFELFKKNPLPAAKGGGVAIRQA
jgi:hypothetical protein